MNAQNTILFLIAITVRCEEDPKIRIGLPEYICDKDGGIRDVSKDMTTIRLLGKDAQSVSYKFDVNFHTIGKHCQNSQRCTLLLWKDVRELDDYLKNYPSAKLQTGIIEINNTMLKPGIKYIVNVIVLSAGNIIDQKRLTLDYVDEEVRKKVTKPMASLLLLGPDVSYAYATFVMNADVNICSSITSYFFNWELVDAAENVTLIPFKTGELTIAPDTLQGPQRYIVRCSLVNTADGATIATSQQDVNVLSKGLLLRLPVKRLTTRTDQPVHLRAYMRDLDNMDGEIRISWSCLEITSNEECDYHSDTTEFEMDSGFKKPGTYKISLEISKSDFTETDSCTVEIVDDAPVIEIEEIEFPTNPSSGVEIHASIYQLRPWCNLRWTSPSKQDYEPLDLTSVPGGAADSINVTMKEDFFLNELEEYSNGTVDMRHDLTIPPPSGTWAGLKGDVTYLFRLVIQCPAQIDEYNETVIAEMTTTTDVTIETNSAPKMQQLEVTPLEGEAFLTSFTFKTLKGEDKDGDGPILYKFGFVLGERDVVLWNLGDVTNCEATLPYSEEGIQTFVESCDNFSSCSRVLGPLIKTEFPEGIDSQIILKRFVAKLEGEDYSKAFNEAFTILHSYKWRQENITREFISEKIHEEVEKFLKMEDDDVIAKNSATELMRNINEFNPYLQLPEAVINGVLELRNKLSDEPERYMQRQLLSLRSKRATMTLRDVRNYLEISELIITTSNDPNKIRAEKENLRKQLRNYMEKLCFNLKKAQQTLELKTLIFAVEKLNKNSLNTLFSIPFEGNSWQTMARLKLGNAGKDIKYKCIGKAVFKDYLNRSGEIFYADILNNHFKGSADVTIYLPKNKSEEGNPECLVFHTNAWHSDCKVVQNIGNFVKCSCKHLGYFSLEYGTVTSPGVLISTSTVTVTTPLSVTEETENFSNESLARIYEGNGTRANYDTISYVVIVASVIGIIVLAVTIRKIFHDDDDNDEAETFEFPKYAQLHNEEFLNDAHM